MSKGPGIFCGAESYRTLKRRKCRVPLAFSEASPGWIQPALLLRPRTETLYYVFASSSRWMRLGRLILLAGPALCCSASGKTDLPAANGPEEAGAELFEIWQEERAGWPQNSVTAIAQTHDGYLWLGTYHGLVRS